MDASKIFTNFSETLSSNWASASTATSQFAANVRDKAASYGNHIYEQLPSAADIQAKAAEFGATIQGHASSTVDSVKASLSNPEVLQSTARILLIAGIAGFALLAIRLIDEAIKSTPKSQEEEYSVCASGQFVTPEGERIAVVLCGKDDMTLARYTDAFEKAIVNVAASAA
ncbi:MAG: hypothetical protein JSS30_08185 [Verrucomicrobia bacterium]|nr:hypothetical protein [Verrucomicrobiota bacterium]